jgi:hypothetical protein
VRNRCCRECGGYLRRSRTRPRVFCRDHCRDAFYNRQRNQLEKDARELRRQNANRT